MEKPVTIDHHQELKRQLYPKQHTLKCPRCDSSNTKFCYYNNYSLSQPRHFCKSCKRYWTRGGTLRNVPVGGGCRKNKRVKIPPTTNPTTSDANTTTTTCHVGSTSKHVDQNPNPNSDHLSSFYLVPQNSNYQMFNTFVSECDFSQPQISNLGLGFSSSQNSSLFVSSYTSSMFASSSTSAPTMASLLASGFQQQERLIDCSNHFENSNNDMASSAPNSLFWNMSGGLWFDPTSNIHASVRSSI